MALIHISELHDLVVKRATDTPEVINVSFAGDVNGSTSVIDDALANRTVTYEARQRTVILDFDACGYLTNIGFV